MQKPSTEKISAKIGRQFVTSAANPFINLGGDLVGETVGYSHTLTIAAIVSAIGTAAIGLIATKREPQGKARILTKSAKKASPHA
jgi:hypothetical protein